MFLSFFILFIICNIALAGGLSTRFIQAKLKGLTPGETYSVEKKTGQLLIINNTTESKVDIGIKPEIPIAGTLVSGYEPIPDLSWVVIKKSYFKNIGSNKSAKTDILVTIPPGKEYLGKKYQVYIYSHTAGKETMRMGIMSRILIEIEE